MCKNFNKNISICSNIFIKKNNNNFFSLSMFIQCKELIVMFGRRKHRVWKKDVSKCKTGVERGRNDGYI